MTDEVAALSASGALMLHADLADDAGVTDVVAQVRRSAVSLRAVIHNASVWYSDDVLMQDPALLAATYALHVFTPHRLNEAWHDLLTASGQGHIVFLTDANVPRGKADRSLYLASKAAMESLMRSHARKWAPAIQVNAIAPGLLAFHADDDVEYRRQRLSHSLLGIEPGFDTVVEAVHFLLQNCYINASVLTLDGGRQ